MARKAIHPKRGLPRRQTLSLADIRTSNPGLEDFCTSMAADGWRLPKNATVFIGRKTFRLVVTVSRSRPRGRTLITEEWILDAPDWAKAA